MDTNIYRYVVAVAECRSISAAARKLFISQPALTKHLRKLEDSLGITLFNRTPASVTPTPSGEIFLEYAAHYLKMEEEMNARLFQQAGVEKMHLKVATSNRGGKYVGDYTVLFLNAYPNISPEYLFASAERCEEALENEEVELAVYTDPVISGRLEYMPLEEDPLILLVPRNNKLLEGKDIESNGVNKPVEIEPERFQNTELTYILSTPDHSLYHAENSFFKKYKITPQHYFRVDLVDTRCSITCAGGGISLFPRTTVAGKQDLGDAVICTVKGEDMYRYVIIAKKKGHILSKSAEMFWRFMVDQKFTSYNKSE